jgi:TM2 domain-containing membrane protein YozV
VAASVVPPPVPPPPATYVPQAAAPLSYLATAAPRPNQKKPAAAVLLSLFPGLGQVYNGQISKGLTFFAIWLGAFYAAIEVGPLPWIFVMIFAYLYNLVDAWRSAVTLAARAQGAPEEEVEDSPWWGGLLVLLGLVLLLNNLGWLRLMELQRFWPALLIVAGGATLFNSLRRRQAKEAASATRSEG